MFEHTYSGGTAKVVSEFKKDKEVIKLALSFKVTPSVRRHAVDEFRKRSQKRLLQLVNLEASYDKVASEAGLLKHLTYLQVELNSKEK